MNALTKAAKHSVRRETIENYIVAIACGLFLGLMLGMGV